MQRSLKALLVASATVPAVTGGLMDAHLAPDRALAAAQHATSTTKKYKGPIVDMRWGPVQATIYIKKGKITKVNIATSPENSRSQFIDDNSVPMLQSETLSAQNVNIDLISGATMTSEAYVMSLQKAVKSAVKHRDLTSKALK